MEENQTPVEPTNDNNGDNSPPPTEVIPSDSDAPVTRPVEAPPAQKSHNPGMKYLVLLLVVLILGAGGYYYVYHKNHTKKTAAVATSTAPKTIPHLSIGIVDGNYGDKLYPNMEPSSDSGLVNAQIFEGLVRYENHSKVVPDLASSWTNPDDNTWLFTIKSGVKFHDGNLVTPAAVKSSLDYLIGNQSDLAQAYATTLKSVEVVGTNQVKITTAQPDPALLNRLSFMYIYDPNLPKGDEPSLSGSGPYEVKPGTTPNQKDVELVAYDHYHGGQVMTKALSFGTEATVAAVQTAYKAHKYNIIGEMPSDSAAANPGSKQFISSESEVYFIGFNTKQPGPLQNKLVREAVRYALNPTTIGQARGAKVTPISQLIPPSIPGYNPAIKPYQQDVAKAKQLLTQAGYPNGTSITFSTNDASKASDEVVKELKAVGITAKLDYQSDFDKFITGFSSGKLESYSVVYASDILDGLDIYQTVLVPDNYDNPKLDALLTKASSTIDPSARLKLLQQAAVIVDQDIPLVPLSTRDNLWLLDKNYVMQQDLPASFISVYFYKVHL